VIHPARATRRRQPCKREPMKPRTYRIVVEGRLGSPRYSAAFGHMRLEVREGTTEIVGMVEDQAALQGLLDTVTALGLSLVSAAPLDD
jgi:hypothetical protein